MSIAQHFVAGEEGVHPPETEPLAADLDAQARVQFTCDTTNLPWVIFRAAHRAAHLTGLPARSRALLAALARTVDAARPYAAIFARRELLTGRAMQSMRTFYRGLDDLEAAGLILRAPQKRYGEAGLFGRAYLHLTSKSAQLLGLVTAPPAPDEQVDSEPAEQPASKAGPSVPVPPSASVADRAIYKDLSPGSFQKRQPGQVPVDLQRLRSLGFHEFLIFRLMREARQHGKRLSDVVDATWPHLKQANRPICYLRSLLASPVDFGHQVRARRAAADDAQRRQHEASVIRETLVRCAGGVFFDAKGERRIEIGEGGTSMTVHDLREAAPRVAGGTWEAAFVQALETGHIRRSTPEAEETFATARRTGPGLRGAASLRLSTDLPARVLTAEIGARLTNLKALLKRAEAGRTDAHPLPAASGQRRMMADAASGAGRIRARAGGPSGSGS